MDSELSRGFGSRIRRDRTARSATSGQRHVRRGRACRGYRLAALAAIGIALVATTARGIINPRFTPSDLVRSCSEIVLLKVSTPKDKALVAEVLETLKGTPLPEKTLKLVLDEKRELGEDAVAGAFGDAKTATAMLMIYQGDKPADDTPCGALQIGINWFSVFKDQNKWVLDQDKRDLFSVWAGSARMLAEATKYVQADAAAHFPVKSDVEWGADQALGGLAGKAHGCLVADFGAPIGLCAVVLAEGGDRIYQAGKGAKPVDITQKVKLTTSSKIAAAGDFDGDGRVDLACWDGKALKLAAQTAEGTFAVKPIASSLAECLSLDAIDVGVPASAGLVAGTPQGPVVMAPDKAGGFAARALAGEADRQGIGVLGPGGLCVVADFDADGRCDILQCFRKGMMLYAGDGAGRFKAPAQFPGFLMERPRAAVCGDFDADGRLDVVIVGDGGMAVLLRTPEGRWENLTYVTGELAYHGNANQPQILGAAPCDINNDARQGVSLVNLNRKPMAFFNRGFACFGWARELDPTGAAGISEAPPDPFATAAAKPVLEAWKALEAGQMAGTMWDLDGDGVQDMLGVDLQNKAWVLFGKAEGRKPLGLTVALTPKAPGPVTVTVNDGKRIVGMHVVRPGVPAYIGRTGPGPLILQWPGADGKPQTRKEVIMGLKRVELGP